MKFSPKIRALAPSVFLSALLGMFLSVSSRAQAQSDNWTGAAYVEGDWFTDSKWSYGYRPNAYIHGTLGSGARVAIASGDASANNLFLSNATLNIAADGSLSTAVTFLGYTFGTMTVNVNGGRLQSNALYVGYEGGSGNLTVRNMGSLNTPVSSIIGQSAAGTVTIESNAVWNTANLYLGYKSDGRLFLASGGKLVSNSASLGDWAETGAGYADVGQGSVWTNATTLVIGDNANGWLSVHDGGVVNAGSLLQMGSVYSFFRGVGTVVVDDAGSVLGADTINLAHASTITVQNGGALLASHLSLSGTSTVTFDGGILRAKADAADLISTYSANSIILSPGGISLDTNGFSVGLGAVLSGTGGLTKTGNGTLTLTGNGGFSGGVTVKAGVLEIASDASLGAASGALTMAGGTLRTTANMGIARPVNLAADSALDLANQTYLTITSTVSGDGGLTKAGTGYLTLTGEQTYTGPTDVRGGFFKLESGSLTSSAVNLASAIFYLSNSTGELAADITGIGSLVRGGTGTSILTGMVAPTVSITIESGVLGFSRNDASSYDGVISGAGALLKQGSGAFTLTGANTYTGGTTILAGRLVAGSAIALRSGTSGAGYAVEGGTLDLNNFALTVSSLSGAAGDIDLGTATLTVNQSGTTSFGGAITGTGGVSKLGNGSLTLSGVSNFAGALSPNAGTLTITGQVTSGQTSGIATTGTTAALVITGSGANWTSNGDTLIGHNGGTGYLTISDGATASDAFSLVGRSAGGAGHVTVTGPGSAWTHSAGLVIGTGGEGTMLVENGAQVSNADGTIGGEAGSSGAVRVTGAVSLWTSSSYLLVGNAGAGVLNVDGGGTVKVGSTGAGILTLGNSSAGSGILNIGAASGQSALAAGTIKAAEITGGSGSGEKLVNFNHTGAAYVFAPVLTGNLSVRQNSGVTILTGNNTYSGLTTVSGGTLLVNGSLTGATLVQHGTLGGSGVLGGAVTVQDGGILSPGNSPGQITLLDDLTLEDGATLLMQFRGTAAGAFDQIDVQGLFTAGGTLSLMILDSYTATYGDTFTIFNGATPGFDSGAFTLATNLGGGLSWDTSALATDGIVSIVPEPATWILAVLGFGALLWRGTRRPVAVRKGVGTGS